MALFGGGGSSDNELKITVTAETEQAKKNLQDLDKSLGNVGQNSSAASNSFSLLDSSLAKATLGAVSVGAAMSALNATLDNALKVENLTRGFDNLQNTIGKDSVTAMSALQQATTGLISKMDLMQSANQAVLLGVDDGSGKFEKLSGAALKLGSAMGINAKEALDSLVVGIGRGSKLVLDNLGIVVDTEQAYRDFAKQIGKTADALSDSEKKAAFQAAAFKAVEESAAALGEPTDTAALAYARLKISLSDSADASSVAASESDALKSILNAITPIIGGVGGAVNALTDAWDFLSEKIANIIVYIDQVALGILVSFGKAISDIASGKLPSLERSLQAGVGAANALGIGMTKTTGIVSALGLDFTDFDKILAEGTSKANKYAGSLSGGGGDKSIENAAKKAKAALEDLRKSVSQETNKDFVKDLTENLIKASKAGDGALADKLKNQIKEALNKGYTESFLGKGGKLSAEAGGLITQQVENDFKEIEVKVGEALKKGSEEGTKFWAGLMEDAISQSRFSWEDQFKKGGVAIISDFLSGFEGMTASFESLFKNVGSNLKSIFTEIAKGTEASFSAIEGNLMDAGTTFGLAYSAQVGANVYTAVSKGDKISGNDQTGIAATTGMVSGGLTNAAASLYNSYIGSKNDPIANARKDVEKYVEELLGTNVVFGKFKDDFESSFDDISGSARGAFESIGDVIRSLAGVSEDVGAQIGYIFAENFGGTIDDLKYLVSDLGLTFEQVQDQMVQAFLAGDQSAQEVIATLAGIEEAFKPGLEGAGQFTKAMDNLIASMGTGKESLKSLKDLAVEFKETGGKTLGEFQAALEASGKYTSAQIQQLFTALSQRGITSLDQLAGASDLTLIGIIADLQTLGFKFSDSIGEGVKDSIKDIDKLRETISKLPDTVEKNLKINVSTSYSDNQAKGALGQLTGSNNPGIARQ